MKLKNWIGQSYVSRNIQFDCSRTVNWMPDVDENQTGASQQISQLFPCPGLTNRLNAVVNGQSIRGGFTTSAGQSFFVAGNSLYYLQGSFAPYSPVFIGNLLTTHGKVRFADNGTQMVLVDGQFGYYVTLSNQVMTQITDSAFYGSAFVEYYDGYFIFAQPGTGLFYWTNPNSVTFDALNFATKSGNADPLAGFFVLQRQLWLIGTQTTELWYDVGGTATFQRLSGPYNEWGCIAPDTIDKSETSGFWVAQSISGGAQVVVTNGNSIEKIGGGSVDWQLQVYDGSLKRSTGFCYQSDGCLFYFLNPFNGASSFVYDHTTSQILGLHTWHERTYTIQPSESTIAVPNGTEQRHLADCAWMYNNEVLVGSYRSANVYTFDNNSGTDNGAYITRTRQSPHQVSEFNRIFYSLFRLFCQTGQGSQVTVVTLPGPVVGNTLSASMTIGGFGDTPYTVGFAEAKYGEFGVLPFGSFTPNTIPGVGNVGLFIAGAETFNSGIPKNVHVIIETSGNVLTQHSIANVSFIDRHGNVQFYDVNTSVFSYNGANTPPDGSWLWAPPTQVSYNAFVNGACTTVTIGYTSQGANISQQVFTSPEVMLSWSDDGGNNWSNELPQSVGDTGRYGQLVEWWQLGEGRNRVFRVRYTGTAPLALMDAFINAQATAA